MVIGQPTYDAQINYNLVIELRNFRMLTALRNGSDNWFVKAFLGIVVLGFIATGGLLSYSSVQSNNHVANIGEISVTADEFYADYSREVNRYSQQLGQNLESPFLKFIEQSVVDKLISSATLENAGKMLNLAIDDAEAVKVITADNNFKATMRSESDTLSFEL